MKSFLLGLGDVDEVVTVRQGRYMNWLRKQHHLLRSDTSYMELIAFRATYLVALMGWKLIVTLSLELPVNCNS